MLRRSTLALLATCGLACAAMAAVADLAPSRERTVATDPAVIVDCSHPSDNSAYWRAGQATIATFTASPWRFHQLHARLAVSPVLITLAALQQPAPVPTDESRPHGPPHLLNDSLLI